MATVEVSESEAAFLDEAAATISKMAQQVAAIPPKSFYDFGSSWGEQFGPFYDRLQQLLDRGRLMLSPGSDAQAQFLAGVNTFNKALGRAQNAEEGWESAIGRFAVNPLLFTWKAGKAFASAEYEGASLYAGEAADIVGKTIRKEIEDTAAAIPWGKIGIAALVLGAVLVGTRR